MEITMKTIDKRGIPGKNRQFPDQITMDAKRYLIISSVAQGKTYSEILSECVASWGLGIKSVQNIINETLQYMRSEETKETLISMNNERLDNIISESMNEGDRKSAIKAIDVQNKLIGGYTENIKIDGNSDITLNFEF